jgi:hypothetical protein
MTCPLDRSRKSVSLFYWSPNTDEIKHGSYISFLPGTRRTKGVAFLRSLVPPIVFAVKDAVTRALKGAPPYA